MPFSAVFNREPATKGPVNWQPHAAATLGSLTASPPRPCLCRLTVYVRGSRAGPFCLSQEPSFGHRCSGAPHRLGQGFLRAAHLSPSFFVSRHECQTYSHNLSLSLSGFSSFFLLYSPLINLLYFWFCLSIFIPEDLNWHGTSLVLETFLEYSALTITGNL